MSFIPKRLYHVDGSLPAGNEVFVFGSNLAGRHGKGAALIARERFGAIYGQGIGHVGQSYALPTKDEHLQILQPYQIVYGIAQFVDYTYARPDLMFFVTAVACGLADHDPGGIAPLFAMAINCSFPDTWRQYLEH